MGEEEGGLRRAGDETRVSLWGALTKCPKPHAILRISTETVPGAGSYRLQLSDKQRLAGVTPVTRGG